MKVYILIIFFLCALSLITQAQQGNNWCLGRHGGINFNKNP